jgi:hypothetical protein
MRNSEIQNAKCKMQNAPGLYESTGWRLLSSTPLAGAFEFLNFEF